MSGLPEGEPARAIAPAVASTSEIIDAWFVEHFHGHPAMRDTETFNHLRAATNTLKARLVTPEEGH